MKLSKALQRAKEAAEARDSYWVEKAKLDFAVALERRRKTVGLPYAALAKKLATSAAYISKVFRGDSNLTIESMVKLARASGGRLDIQVIDGETGAKQWAHKVTLLKQKTVNEANTTGAVVLPFRSSSPQDRRRVAA